MLVTHPKLIVKYETRIIVNSMVSNIPHLSVDKTIWKDIFQAKLMKTFGCTTYFYKHSGHIPKFKLPNLNVNIKVIVTEKDIYFLQHKSKNYQFWSYNTYCKYSSHTSKIRFDIKIKLAIWYIVWRYMLLVSQTFVKFCRV